MDGLKKFLKLGVISMLCWQAADAEESLGFDHDYYRKIVNHEFNLESVNKFFESYAKKRQVELKAFRGDFFEPRCFWEQPINKILEYLRPELEKHEIFDLIADTTLGCFNYTADYQYPMDRELALENDVEKKLEKFAQENGIDPKSYNFKKSLQIGRKNGVRLPICEKFVPATPLISFWEPYIVDFEG